jgi:uncharacterized membrane protein
VKRNPGPLWLFFYGRQRKGFPWLLVGVIVAVVLLGLTFAIPGAPDVWRAIAPFVFGFLLLAGVLAAIVAVLRPRRRR